jgi:hypothetical protein
MELADGTVSILRATTARQAIADLPMSCGWRITPQRQRRQKHTGPKGYRCNCGYQYGTEFQQDEEQERPFAIVDTSEST